MTVDLRRPTVIAACVLLTAGLAGCNPKPAPDALYPLDVGLRWTYRVTTTRDHGTNSKGWRYFRNIHRGYFAGEQNVTIRRNDDGIRYWDVQRADGYYRVASRTLADSAPVMDQPAVKILPLPARPGATWREPAHTFLLERARTFISAHTPANTIVLDYHIESADAAVHVPAGLFSHCVIAVGQTTFHLGASVGVAPSEVPIVQREWYCPGVGLTRLTRDEKLTSNEKTITGGHIDVSLVAGPG